VKRIPFGDARSWQHWAAPVANHLRQGGLIAYPTETVYGFGCALDPAPLAALARLKQRDAGKAFLVLIHHRAHAPGLAWTPEAERLADAFWPGPLTLALRAEGRWWPAQVLSRGTVAIRATPHEGVRAFLSVLGAPVSSTSANRPGRPPAATCDDVIDVLSAVDVQDMWVLDGGPLPPSMPSTVVDCSTRPVRVLREGAIPVAALRSVVEEIDA
jgi:L-threonylcarbamoyladenylate synthase